MHILKLHAKLEHVIRASSQRKSLVFIRLSKETKAQIRLRTPGHPLGSRLSLLPRVVLMMQVGLSTVMQHYHREHPSSMSWNSFHIGTHHSAVATSGLQAGFLSRGLSLPLPPLLSLSCSSFSSLSFESGASILKNQISHKHPDSWLLLKKLRRSGNIRLSLYVTRVSLS